MVKIENPKGAITIEDEVFANLAGDAATSWARTAASLWSCT